MGYNNRKKEYTMQYIKDHCDRMVLNVRKGKREQYKQLAKSEGKSLSKLITDLLEAEMNVYKGGE